jgi:hypothetical protein
MTLESTPPTPSWSRDGRLKLHIFYRTSQFKLDAVYLEDLIPHQVAHCECIDSSGVWRPVRGH